MTPDPKGPAMTDQSGGHTPGRWVAGDTQYQQGYRTFVNVMTDRDDFIACVSSDPMHPETIAANASLIAAAPDLLAALTTVMREFFPHATPDEYPELADARAAITLATGAAS